MCKSPGTGNAGQTDHLICSTDPKRDTKCHESARGGCRGLQPLLFKLLFIFDLFVQRWYYCIRFGWLSCDDVTPRGFANQYTWHRSAILQSMTNLWCLLQVIWPGLFGQLMGRSLSWGCVNLWTIYSMNWMRLIIMWVMYCGHIHRINAEITQIHALCI